MSIAHIRRDWRERTEILKTLTLEPGSDASWVADVTLGSEQYRITTKVLWTAVGVELVISFLLIENEGLLLGRVYAIEGDASDLWGSLRRAIRTLQRELRRKSPYQLRREGRSPVFGRRPLPAETRAQMLKQNLAATGRLGARDRSTLPVEPHAGSAATMEGLYRTERFDAAATLLARSYRHDDPDAADGHRYVRWLAIPASAVTASRQLIAEATVDREGTVIVTFLSGAPDLGHFDGDEAQSLFTLGRPFDVGQQPATIA